LIGPLRQGGGSKVREILSCPTHPHVLEELLRGEGPRIVLIEEQALPCRPGQLCRDIRELPIEDYCYIVVLLEPGSDKADAFFEAGADDCVESPAGAARLGVHLQAAFRITQLNAQLSEIHRSAPVAMILLDANGCVKHSNPAAQRLRNAGMDPSHKNLLPCLESLIATGRCGHSEYCEGCQAYALLKDALEKGAFHDRCEVSVPRQVPAQNRLHLLVSTAPITVGHAQMILVSLEDVTRTWRARRRLHSTISELKAFNRLAIGRELQMVSLKRQINDLHRQVGAEAPYDVDFAEPEPLDAAGEV
jgi:hypothetical protein